MTLAKKKIRAVLFFVDSRVTIFGFFLPFVAVDVVVVALVFVLRFGSRTFC